MWDLISKALQTTPRSGVSPIPPIFAELLWRAGCNLLSAEEPWFRQPGGSADWTQGFTSRPLPGLAPGQSVPRVPRAHLPRLGGAGSGVGGTWTSRWAGPRCPGRSLGQDGVSGSRQQAGVGEPAQIFTPARIWSDCRKDGVHQSSCV